MFAVGSTINQHGITREQPMHNSETLIDVDHGAGSGSRRELD